MKLLGGTLAIGLGFLIDGKQGPFVRIGVQGYIRGNDSFTPPQRRVFDEALRLGEDLFGNDAAAALGEMTKSPISLGDRFGWRSVRTRPAISVLGENSGARTRAEPPS